MQKIRKVYVVTKRSVYGKYVLEDKNATLMALIKKNHVSTRKLLDTHHRHLKSLELVENVLKKLKIEYKISDRANVKNLLGCDLVITVGGDGTLLRMAHHIENQLLLGVNSTPHVSVGRFCAATSSEFENKIKKILAAEFRVQPLIRMLIKVNKKTLPIKPINDVLYTNFNPAATSRYIISLGNKREEHKSSGVWVSTPAGSTAAISAAGGISQHAQDRRLQYMTREPYQGIYNPYELVRGFIAEGKQLKIISKMIKSRIYLDGPSQHVTLDFGDTLTIGHSRKVLKLIC